MTTPTRPLAVEQVKRASRALRGSIAEELTSTRSSFSRSNVRLLKFHGVFQKDNRDERSRCRDEGLTRCYQFTVRIRPAGGKLSAEQMLGVFDLADAVGDGNVRITARQGMQLHAVAKRRLKATLRRIAELNLTTLGGGGDVNCNVMCCPAPSLSEEVHRSLQEIAARVSDALMVDDAAYREIWQADRVASSPVETAGRIAPDPLYGPTYLPHKFKVGIALPEDNCSDVYAQDVGLLAVCEAGRLLGFNVLVGGGMGRILSAARSFPALAQPLVFARVEDVVPLVTTVVKIYRDFGNRSDRGKARLKYLVDSWGLERFRQAVEEQLGRRLALPRPLEVTGYEDHLGWHEQADGRWCLGIYVDGGCIGNRDTGNGDTGSLKAALRDILARVGCDVRLTPQQNLLLAGIEASRRDDIKEILAGHDVPGVEQLSNVRRWSMACPALPTCSAAITEAQRIVPELLAALEAELSELGLSDERFTLRVTGCPNGCTRSYLADLALVGRSIDVERNVEKFAIFIGGDTLGRRLNTLYQDLVPADQVVPLLRRLLRRYQQQRHDGESLGDFFARLGVDQLQSGTVDT